MRRRGDAGEEALARLQNDAIPATGQAQDLEPAASFAGTGTNVSFALFEEVGKSCSTGPA
jgi:hypothetical protein